MIPLQAITVFAISALLTHVVLGEAAAYGPWKYALLVILPSLAIGWLRWLLAKRPTLPLSRLLGLTAGCYGVLVVRTGVFDLFTPSGGGHVGLALLFGLVLALPQTVIFLTLGLGWRYRWLKHPALWFAAVSLVAIVIAKGVLRV